MRLPAGRRRDRAGSFEGAEEGVRQKWIVVVFRLVPVPCCNAETSLTMRALRLTALVRRRLLIQPAFRVQGRHATETSR
jgi:hypothetical protein